MNKNPKSLTIIEKDYNLAQKLKIKFTENILVKVINADILKFDIEKIINKNSAILGNLPYNISSQILVKIIKFKNWPPNFSDLIFMFQKELGEKIVGQYPSSDYSRLSILSGLRLNILGKFLISPNCFFPKPKVISMVIHFQPKIKNSFIIKKIENLEKITNIFFSNKRKMINKNVKKILSSKKINKISNLNVNLRPSDIRPEIYYKITELYEQK